MGYNSIIESVCCMKQVHGVGQSWIKAGIDHHLSATFSDAFKEQYLGHCQSLIELPAPMLDFDGKKSSVPGSGQEGKGKLSLGPSGVRYKVYKNCPKLLHRLWRIMKVIWRKRKVAEQWQLAEGVWILKEEESKNIDQFRTIVLLSVEGKIFFSIIARCLTDYLLRPS